MSAQLIPYAGSDRRFMFIRGEPVPKGLNRHITTRVPRKLSLPEAIRAGQRKGKTIREIADAAGVSVSEAQGLVLQWLWSEWR